MYRCIDVYYMHVYNYRVDAGCVDLEITEFFLTL